MEPTAPKPVDQFSINDALMVQDLPEGIKVKLRNGATAEVTANPRDGGWLFVRYLEFADEPSLVGTDQMAFCTDVVSIIQ
jgi:hypothetical protein